MASTTASSGHLYKYKGMSQVLLDVLGKLSEWTGVIFEEVEMENWGRGGMPVAEYRKLLAQRSGSGPAGFEEQTQ